MSASILLIKNVVIMLTDRAPRKPALLAAFLESERNKTLDTPQDNRLQAPANLVESSLAGQTGKSLRLACAGFLGVASVAFLK